MDPSFPASLSAPCKWHFKYFGVCSSGNVTCPRAENWVQDTLYCPLGQQASYIIEAALSTRGVHLSLHWSDPSVCLGSSVKWSGASHVEISSATRKFGLKLGKILYRQWQPKLLTLPSPIHLSLELQATVRSERQIQCLYHCVCLLQLPARV